MENLLYVPVARHANLRQLDNLLHGLPSPPRRAADAVIIRTHDPEAKELLTSPDIQGRVRHRVEMKPLFLLTLSDREFRLTPLGSEEGGDGPQLGQSTVVQCVRQAELTILARQPGALLPPAPNFHYEGPNGSHYASFLRVGTALQSIDAVDAVSFWTMPYLTANSAVVLDSPSILALGLNLPRYIADCGYGGRFHLRLVECQRSYDEPAHALVQRLSAPAERLTHVLLIMSVSSTGRLRDQLASALGTMTEQVTIVSLFGSAPGRAATHTVHEEILCPLDEQLLRHPLDTAPLLRYDPAECLRCRAGSAVVRIDPNTYLVEVAAAISQVRVRIGDAADGRRFVERYRGLGSLTVHRDQHDRQRHHMVHIDVARLLRSRGFEARLQDVLVSC